MPITIISCDDRPTLEACARIMCTSEPWVSLKRDYTECFRSFIGDFREVYIAVNNNILLGFIVLQMQGPLRGYIQSVAVVENARRHGIGTMLISFVEKRIFAVSPNVFLFVSSFNQIAQTFYFKLGYEKAGTLNNFFVNGYSEIILRKTIGPISEFAAK